jgi:hypothetical protein
MTDFMTDREAPAARPAPGLLRVDPDLPEIGQKKPRKMVEGELLTAGSGRHVVGQTNPQAEHIVDYRVDRNGQ